jgi:tRNA1(Val) A37 N6-methylase TrmN6
MVTILENEIIDDLMCDGLRIIRDTNSYAYTSDSVLLANFAKAGKSDRVLDLGTGSGIIPLLMSKKTKALEFVAIEIQTIMVDLAKRSVELNNLTDRIKILHRDMRELTSVEVGRFDVAIANPPYYIANNTNAGTGSRLISRSEVMITLDEVVCVAHKLLNYGGLFYLIIKADRLVDCITSLRKYKLEPKLLVPVQPTINKPIDVVLIKAKNGGRSGLIFEKPIIIQPNLG